MDDIIAGIHAVGGWGGDTTHTVDEKMKTWTHSRSVSNRFGTRVQLLSQNSSLSAEKISGQKIKEY